jgi:hypothetical protein
MANDGKFLTLESGRTKQEQAIHTSSGSEDGGKLARLDPTTGRFHESVMPAGIGADLKIFPASENLSAGNFVNIWSDGGTLKARKADANTSGKEADGFVLSGVSTNENVEVRFEGLNNQLTSLTPGVRYYLSAATPGEAVTTAPSSSGNVVQYLGKSVSTTELSFEASDGVILS